MQLFEFYFNPKAKEEEIYQTFLFEPTNILERKLGSLYLVGNLSKTLPQNFKFLEKLVTQIKKRYYFLSAHSSEKALRESLRKANEFLADEVQKGNVSWLGNLNLAVCSLKNYFFNFTLVGSVKVFLLRSGKLIDIGKNLELEEMEPWPLKIFGNIVSGKLSERDKILILTKDIFDFFSEQNLFQEIAELEEIEEKKLKQLLKSREKLFTEISGIFLLIDLSEKITAKEKVSFEKRLPSLSIWPPHHFWIRFVKFIPKVRVPRWKAFPFSISYFFRTLFAKLMPKTPAQKWWGAGNLKRNLLLILFLILILLFGGYFGKLERGKEMKAARTVLEKTEQKIDWAERVLLLKDEEKANQFYQEAWQEILPQTKIGSILEKEALELKTKIENQLFALNQLERVISPEILFDFEELGFIPQKQLIFQENLYFFSPADTRLFQLNIKEKKGEFIQANQKFNLAVSLENKLILFYLRPDLLFPLKDNQVREKITLKVPYSGFYFNNLSTYKSNFYFLDGQKGEIVKFLFKEGEGEISGKLWLNQKAKKPVEARSLAIDGLIWILTKGNSIDKYYTGNFQETLKLDFFPYPKNLSKIFIKENLPYLYLLEPAQKRIIILDKSGEIIQQFQSEKFDNLKDFSVSEDGKTIYLLNGLKVYQISF